ncbi:MAG: hypothetical protein HYV03_06910 [Deltaproteobacteria bacterium]|nr:hypothetical protein [Deltaproteobacteria bacterium]
MDGDANKKSLMNQGTGQLGAAVLGILGVMAIGGLLPLWWPGIRRHLPLALAAAAGIMLGTSALHL